MVLASFMASFTLDCNEKNNKTKNYGEIYVYVAIKFMEMDYNDYEEDIND